MKRFCLVVMSAVVLWVSGAGPSSANAYFPGKWAFETADMCSQTDGEFVMFEADGSFRVQRFGKAELVGFWSEQDNVLTLEILTAPKRERPRLRTYETIFSQDTMIAVLQERMSDYFLATATLNDETATVRFHRC